MGSDSGGVPGSLASMLRPTPPAPPVNGVRIAVIGTVAWAVALVVAVLDHAALSESGRGWWIGCAAVGVLLGLFGIAFLRLYERQIANR
jgi:hypothetical protein